VPSGPKAALAFNGFARERILNMAQKTLISAIVSAFPKTAAIAGALALILGVAAACTPRTGILPPVSTGGESGGQGQQGAQPAFSNYPDVPLPGGTEIDVEKTMTVGGGENWYGRLVLNASFGAFQMFDFYKQKMAEFGWQEFSAVRGPISVLTYSRQNRVATIQIQGKRLGGSTSTVTVSPQGSGGSFGTAPSGGFSGGPPQIPSAGTLPVQPTIRR